MDLCEFETSLVYIHSEFQDSQRNTEKPCLKKERKKEREREREREKEGGRSDGRTNERKKERGSYQPHPAPKLVYAPATLVEL